MEGNMGKRGRAITATAVLVMGICGTIVVTNAVNQTKYREQRDCFLCGDTDETILALYDNVNGLGMLSFNNFNIATLRICNEDPDIDMYGHQSTTNSNGEGGSIIQIDSFVERRFAEVAVHFRENSKPDMERMSQFLCEDCAKNIAENNKYDVGFIDYQTREITPIEDNIRQFYIGDYVVYGLDSNEEESDYLIFYAPDQV